MKVLRNSLACVACCFLALASFSIFASAYVGTQDKQLHYDLQTLAEWGYLDAAVTTYPVPWKGVAVSLRSISPEAMPFRPQQAYLRLKHYLDLNSRMQARQFFTLEGATDDVRFRSFDEGVEQTGKFTSTSEFYTGRLSGQLSVNYEKGGEYNFDRSFVAYQFGDWNLRLGSIDQWWGPAQSSSLIMSNNTRPVKAIALSRSTNTRSQSKWLSWLGPWYFTTQMGQMESQRTVPNVKLFMNRFNARPFKGFEIGLSWAAMWSGDGQNEGFKEFAELITFKAICAQDDGVCGEGELSKRGNHIAGIDLSYSTMLFNRPFTFYAQRVGEDSVDGYKITDNANLFGLSTYIYNAKVFIETSDTNIACGENENAFNCYYEHNKYLDGYRMYGRTLGSTFDSDAKQLTLGANLRFSSGDIMELYIRSAELNKDGTRSSPMLTKANTEDLLELSGFYQKPIGDWLLKAGGSVSSRKFEEIEDEVDALLYLKAQYAF